MPYISTKCRGDGPHTHEDCVTGPSPFTAGEKQWCECECHSEWREQIGGLIRAGWTPAQIRRMWLNVREQA